MKRDADAATAAGRGPGRPFAARAETWPAKPIRVILPGPAGGLIDIAGRAISEAMQKELGQTWLIDPRPGANGIMAGQMLLGGPGRRLHAYLTVSGHVALPFLMKVPFDAMADFKPIAMVGVSTALLCVPPGSPANNIAEFVAYAKANPGKLNYLNSGNGTGAHLLPELLKIKYGIDVTSISYKGLPPGVQDLLGGRLDLAMVSTALVMQHVKAGRLKALAAGRAQAARRAARRRHHGRTGRRRDRGPLDAAALRPEGAARSIVDKLNEAVQQRPWPTARPEAARRRLYRTHAHQSGRNGDRVAAEHERLGRLIQQLGIRADGTG